MIISIVLATINIGYFILLFICTRNWLTIAVPLLNIPSARECRVTFCPLNTKPGACGARVISGFKYLRICSFSCAVVMVLFFICEPVTPPTLHRVGSFRDLCRFSNIRNQSPWSGGDSLIRFKMAKAFTIPIIKSNL